MTSNVVPSRNLATTSLDQVVSSASNFLFLILLAISSSPGDFARSSTIWTTIAFTIVIQRSVFGIPLILDSNQKQNMAFKLSGPRLGALLLGIPAFLLSLIFFIEGGQEFYLLLGLLIPLVLIQDLGRYVAISQSKGLKALASDTLLLLPIVAAIGFTWFSREALDPLTLLLIFAIGVAGAVMMIFGKNLFKFSPKELKQLLLNDRDRRSKLLLDATLISGTAIGTVLAVWLFYGAQNVAGFNGALTALAPIGLATLIVQLVVQHGIVGSYGQVNRREIKILFGLVFIAILWIIFIRSVPASFGTMFLGETWMLSESLFLAVGLSLVTGMILEFLVVVLRSQGYFVRIVRIRKLSITSIPVVYLLAYAHDLELALAIGMTAIWGLLLVLWITLTTRPFNSVHGL
jgi:O-antigen/teichoic acid export membrane protein